MALLKALCWALIFIIRIRFPPGTSLATVSIYVCPHLRPIVGIAKKRRLLDRYNFRKMSQHTRNQCFHFEGNFLLKGNFEKVKEN